MNIALYLLLSLHPFETDLCTFWPEGTFRDPQKWAQCCVMHDLNYWVGGTQKDRLEADIDLKECVTNAHTKEMGELMFLGVRAGRLSPIRLKGKGWGFAWPKERAKDLALTEEEIFLIRDELYHNQSQIDLEMIEDFIRHLKERSN